MYACGRTSTALGNITITPTRKPGIRADFLNLDKRTGSGNAARFLLPDASRGIDLEQLRRRTGPQLMCVPEAPVTFRATLRERTLSRRPTISKAYSEQSVELLRR